MKSAYIIAVALLSMGLLTSSSADAQKIRNYQQKAESNYNAGNPQAATGSEANYGYVPPGAPRPAPAAKKDEAGASDKKDGEGGVDLNSYEVKMAGTPSTTGRRTTLSLKPEEMYRGVIPGTRDEVTHLTKERKKGEGSTNRIMWVGFQAREQSTRVFIQTAREANYEVTSENGAVVVSVSDAKFSARNFKRFIDTSFFGRNVQRIEAKKTGRKSVEIRITLSKAERPQVNSTQNYVYLEFSADSSKEKAKEDTEEPKEGGPTAMDE